MTSSSVGTQQQQQQQQPLAVVGMSCRLPGHVSSPREFFGRLMQGFDAITEVPSDRWDSTFHDPSGAPGSSVVHRGGFVDGLFEFDHAFWGISAREAATLDPQQRMLLELAYEATEDAGWQTDKVRGSSTGVFVGASAFDWGTMQLHSPRHIDAYTQSGASHAMLANRISYLLDLRGPSVTLDTACASAMTALGLAWDAIAAGRCSAALVGASNVIINPGSTVGFSKLGVLGSSGKCRPFDAQADGYVRSEGAGILVLKPLSKALSDGDRIYCIVRSTSFNCDGADCPGLTSPSQRQQELLLTDALRRAGVSPCDVAYVEAHGTGTRVGDPVEAAAISNALTAGRDARSNPVRVGSVKGNLGHMEPAAGIASLVKLCMGLHRRCIPPTVNHTRLNPEIHAPALAVLTKPLTWQRGSRAALVAMASSFGFGGANATCVLEEFVQEAAEEAPAREERESHRPCMALLVSGSCEASLIASAKRMAELLATSCGNFHKICCTAAARRTHRAHRCAVIARTAGEAKQKLDALSAGIGVETLPSGTFSGQVGQSDPPPAVVLVLSGRGCEWAGMGTTAIETIPELRARLTQLDNDVHIPLMGVSLFDVLADTNAETSPVVHGGSLVVQMAMIALQMALCDLFRAWGLHQPSAVLGHSLGEIPSAYTSGQLSAEDVLRLTFLFSQEQMKGRGKLLLVHASREDVLPLCERSGTFVSVVLSPKCTVIAGTHDAVSHANELCAEKGVRTSLVSLDEAAHTPVMDEMKPAVDNALAWAIPSRTGIPYFSSATPEASPNVDLEPSFWWKMLRNVCNFQAAVERALAAFPAPRKVVFLEVGPHPITGVHISAVAQALGRQVVHIPTLLRRKPGFDCLISAAAALHVSGVSLDWSAVHGTRSRQLADLPAYPWQRKAVWSEPPSFRSLRVGDWIHPLIRTKLDSPFPCFESEVDLNQIPWARDHTIAGNVVMPGMALAEIMAFAAAHVLQSDRVTVTDLKLPLAMYLKPGDRYALRVSTSATNAATAEGGLLPISVSSKPLPSGEWTTHSTSTTAAPCQPLVSHYTDGNPLEKAVNRVDPSSIRALIGKAGLCFGPLFCCCKDVWLDDLRNPTICVAHVQASSCDPPQNQQQSGRPDYFFCHPGAVDALFSCALIFHPQLRERNQALFISGCKWFSFDRSIRPGCSAWSVSTKLDDGCMMVSCYTEDGRCFLRFGELKAVFIPSPPEVVHQHRWTALPNQPLAPSAFHAPFTSAALPADLNKVVSSEVPRLVAEAALETDISRISEANDLLDQLALDPTNKELKGRLLHEHPHRWAAAAMLLLSGSGESSKDMNEVVQSYFRDDSDSRLWLAAAQRVLHEVVAAAVPQGEHLSVLHVAGSMPLVFSEALLSELRSRDAPFSFLLASSDTVQETLAQKVLASYDRSARFCRLNCTEESLPLLSSSSSPLPEGGGGGGGEDSCGDKEAFDLAVLALSQSQDANSVLKRIEDVMRLLRAGGVLFVMDLLPRCAWGEALFHSSARTCETWESEVKKVGGKILWSTSNIPGASGRVLVAARKEPCTEIALQQPTATSKMTATGRIATILVRSAEDGVAKQVVSFDPDLEVDLRDSLQKPSTWWSAQLEALPLADLGQLSVYFCLPLSSSSSAAVAEEEEDPMAGLEASFLSPLEMVKALDQCKCRVQITFLTCGAASAVQAGSRDILRPTHTLCAQCPVVGLARCLHNEYPLWSVCWMDVGSSEQKRRGPSSAEILVARAVVNSEGGPASFADELAVRGEVLYANELVELRTHSALDSPLPELGADRPVALTYIAPGRVAFDEIRLPALGPRDVLVEIAASGLVFRDALLMAGKLPKWVGTTLGTEFSGVVRRVGDSVSDLKPGDQVLGAWLDVCANWTVVPRDLIAKKPPQISFAEAAGLPIQLVTAWYSLETVARIRRGMTVLIHSATGGVGLIALSMCLRAGATCICTAGTHYKRQLLLALGASHVFDSHSADFRDQVLEATAGHRGVDVLINTLGADMVAPSVACLAVGGCFVELGKHGAMVARANTSWQRVAVDDMVKNPAEHKIVGEALERSLELVCSGAVPPLPVKLFAPHEAQEALQFFLRGKHIGKIVLSPMSSAAASIPALPRPCVGSCVRSGASYLIVGGTRGFGLRFALEMARRGAKNLCLISRSVVPQDSQELSSALDEMERVLGARVLVRPASVDNEEQLGRVLEEMRQTLGPIKGVVHSAMVLRDALIPRLTCEDCKAVLRPKVVGSWLLHKLTLQDDLDMFVMLSSISAVIGTASQAPYVAGNVFEDSLAVHRRALGLPAIAVQLGAISDSGWFVQQQSPTPSHLPGAAQQGSKQQQHFAFLGELSSHDISTFILDKMLFARLERRAAREHDAEALGVLSSRPTLQDLPLSAPCNVGIFRANWKAFFARSQLGTLHRFARLAEEYSPKGQAGDEDSGEGAAALLTQEAVTEKLLVIVEKLLGFESGSVTPAAQLTEVGLDSLVAVEMRTQLSRTFNVDVSVTDLLKGLTIKELGAEIHAELSKRFAPQQQQQQQQQQGEEASFPLATSPGPSNDTNAVAIVFCGQGAATKGMGNPLLEKSAEARSLWSQVDTHFQEHLGISLSAIISENPPAFNLAMTEKLQRVYDKLLDFSVDGKPLHIQLPEESFSHPDGLLSSTALAQPATVLFQCAGLAHLRACGCAPLPALVVGGHSLGEYTALVERGVLSPTAAAELVFARGLLMQSAVHRDKNGRSPYAMLSVAPSRVCAGFSAKGLEEVVVLVRAALPSSLLQVVNHNATDIQHVVAGHRRSLALLSSALQIISDAPDIPRAQAVQSALESILGLQRSADEEELKRNKFAVPLPGIDLPFHSALFVPLVPHWRARLDLVLPSPDQFDFAALDGHLLCNTTGAAFSCTESFVHELERVISGAGVDDSACGVLQRLAKSCASLCGASASSALAREILIEHLAWQLALPVRWAECITAATSSPAIKRVIEVAPAPILTTLANKMKASGALPPSTSFETFMNI